MQRKQFYIAVPRQIIPIQTDAEVTKWIDGMRAARGIDHLATNQRLQLPVTKRYCTEKGISNSEFDSQEGLINTARRLLTNYNSVALVCSYSPAEGITDELRKNLGVTHAELSFL